MECFQKVSWALTKWRIPVFAHNYAQCMLSFSVVPFSRGLFFLIASLFPNLGRRRISGKMISPQSESILPGRNIENIRTEKFSDYEEPPQLSIRRGWFWPRFMHPKYQDKVFQQQSNQPPVSLSKNGTSKWVCVKVNRQKWTFFLNDCVSRIDRKPQKEVDRYLFRLKDSSKPLSHLALLTVIQLFDQVIIPSYPIEH